MKKWYIVHGDNAEALKLVFASVSRYTAVSCVRPEQLTDEIKRDGSLIYIGVKGLLTVPKDGYRIKAFRNENGNEVVLLDGDGYANELYAAVDFENVYLVKAIDADTHMPTYFFNDIFGTYPLPEYDESFTPFIKERALWSWGYVIYDYKGYIDHMLRLKLNELIIWSDFPPENADEVVAYAHKKGVRIIWGFSWGWSTSCGDTHIGTEELEKMIDKSAATYERDYAHLGGDGIYFQTFTETKEEKIGGMLIAKAAVTLVNKTATKILKNHPDLKIQFGLHATSVRDKLAYIREVDPRVTILWEDCGAFPYAYIPKARGDFEETLLFTEKIKNLRDGGFGTLFKGMSVLNWDTFRHQPGPYVLGEHSRKTVTEKAEEKRKYWKYLQAYWLANAKYVKKTVEALDSNTLVAALVEDGAFEEKLWFPVALYAEILWDPHRDTETILSKAALLPDVCFG